MGHPFIHRLYNTRYKSIQQTLWEGRFYQIGASGLVLTFLAPYLVSFWIDGKWNEFFAGLAATSVTIIHMVQTFIALRQIDHFHRFIYQGLDTLKFLGYGTFKGVPETRLRKKSVLRCLLTRICSITHLLEEI